MMKTIILLTALFIASIVHAQEAEGTSITVNVKIQKNEGKVRLALYTEETFMKQPNFTESAEVVDGSATVVFKNVPDGTYSILGFHDENNNEKMDFEPNGMPTESYGASNNVFNFGPPTWSDTKFEVGDKPLTMEIKF
ncbi:MAG TPA: DUF2141 domain-containing protein [Salinimicrobium sp.]|nr:DUF2141 domain-containing protein [Salinimicrobium sp.]